MNVLYLIHNIDQNTTYVGFAKSAVNRWGGRYGVFHTTGIPESIGQRVHCTCCRPQFLNADGSKTMVPPRFLMGKNKVEHLLVRAVMRALIGRTLNTNTNLLKPFPVYSTAIHGKKITEVRIVLPPAFGKLKTMAHYKRLSANL
jgi:hypothetical protein